MTSEELLEQEALLLKNLEEATNLIESINKKLCRCDNCGRKGII